MPEYLSPGVYVEEIELGPRPIEGVSTSTAGVVGVTERGPENVPVLVTSFPEYQRLYGGYLDPRDFPNANPNNLAYLPHAVEGFFQNGGQRVYVVRVISDNAVEAAVDLMGPEQPTAYASTLAVRAGQGDAFLVVADAVGLAGSEVLRLDEDATTEYVTLDAGPFPALVDRLLALRAPTYASYGATTSVTPLPALAAAGGVDVLNTTISAAAAAGTNRLTLAALPAAGDTSLARGQLLRISGATSETEYAIVEAAPTATGDQTVVLRHPLAFDHPNGATVDRMAEGGPGAAMALGEGASSRSRLLFTDATIALGGATEVRIGGVPTADPDAAYHQVIPPPNAFAAMALDRPTLQAHAISEPVEVLDLADSGNNTSLSANAGQGDAVIHVADRAALVVNVGDWIRLMGADEEDTQIEAMPATPTDEIRVRQPLRFAHNSGDQVKGRTRNAAATTLMLADIPVGGTTAIFIPDAAFAANVEIEIGGRTASNREHRVLGAAQNPVLLPLATPAAPAPPSRVLNSHPAGARVSLREMLFSVVALDEGAWGNELRVWAENEEPPLVNTTAQPAAPNTPVTLASTSGVEPGSLLEILERTTELAAAARAGDATIQVASAAGIGVNDWIRIDRAAPEYIQVAAAPVGATIALSRPLRRDHDPATPVDRMEANGLPRLAKVLERIGTNQVRFDGAGLPFAITGNWVVRSREFKLTVQWVKRGRANPRTPGEDRVIESETHRYLTLDDRHSHYIGKTIGLTTNDLRIWDRRPDGLSDLVRVADPLTSLQTRTTLRTGPDLIYEVLPSGRRRPVGRWLLNGADDVGGITDTTYRGVDNVDPLLRTGLFALRNEEDISLVAIPGRVSQFIQDALITHAEGMRYRFAVLDSEPGADPTGARLPEVQAQRQQFDTKYAALYYPWLRLRNPFPDNPSQPNDVSIPPSGHVLGIYARTDVTRGVHKAPANEVVVGIAGLQRALTKGEHDVLNPSPMNINVLRDFREQFRGNRVWGARVITSDQEWKYVNVRRLFIYIERSLEIGLQWVVFEPNDEDLWASVRRGISEFLTEVWRSGGLMGTTAEEAYFVKCDRTTMTQSDIDNGRLIVVIGIAPVKPAEFVIIRIGQWQGGSSLEEGLA